MQNIPKMSCACSVLFTSFVPKGFCAHAHVCVWIPQESYTHKHTPRNVRPSLIFTLVPPNRSSVRCVPTSYSEQSLERARWETSGKDLCPKLFPCDSALHISEGETKVLIGFFVSARWGNPGRTSNVSPGCTFSCWPSSWQVLSSAKTGYSTKASQQPSHYVEPHACMSISEPLHLTECLTC